MSPARAQLFNSRDLHEALVYLDSNPLLLRGRHFAQLVIAGEMSRARAAVRYARQVEAANRQKEAQRQARDLRAEKFARAEGRAVAARNRFYAALDRSF
jgi:hypothetical protein